LKYSGHTDFHGKRKLLKYPEFKKYIQYSETFRANPNFQGKRKLFKILKDKKYIFNTVNSKHTPFLSASASCLKTLRDKKYFNVLKMFRANCFSGQAKVVQNSE